MYLLYVFGGVLLTLCGTLLILMLYGFGTMMDPDIVGAAREVAIWRAVIRQPAFPVGATMLFAGVCMLIMGGWLTFHEPE